MVYTYIILSYLLSILLCGYAVRLEAIKKESYVSWMDFVMLFVPFANIIYGFCCLGYALEGKILDKLFMINRRR